MRSNIVGRDRESVEQIVPKLQSSEPLLCEPIAKAQLTALTVTATGELSGNRVVSP